MPAHLTQGSTEPPLSPGKLRLYGMRFCPYDHRVHLVLNAKNVPHDCVFINLKNKPEWYIKKVPSTKVPALLVDGEVLYESLIIADFLDEKYPQQPLHSKDPLQKAKDRILIENFGKVSLANYRVLMSHVSPSTQDFDALVAELSTFDQELAERRTSFFSGGMPGMVDYMIWPWFERFGSLAVLFGNYFTFREIKLKHLVPWVEEMKKDKAVKEYFLNTDVYTKYLQGYIAGEPDFEIPV